MEIKISLLDRDSLKNAEDLKKWLSRERTLPIEHMHQETSAPKPDELGPELLPILTLVLASPVVVEVVKAVFGWLEAKRSESSVSMEINGKTVTFTSKDKELLQDIVKDLDG